MAKFMTVTFGTKDGEMSVLKKNCKSFKAQMRYSKRVLMKERDRVIHDLLDSFCDSTDIEKSSNILREVTKLRKADIVTSRGTIKYLDITIKIIKKE